MMCKGCGAPYQTNEVRCEYCGTHYSFDYRSAHVERRNSGHSIPKLDRETLSLKSMLSRNGYWTTLIFFAKAHKLKIDEAAPALKARFEAFDLANYLAEFMGSEPNPKERLLVALHERDLNINIANSKNSKAPE